MNAEKRKHAPYMKLKGYLVEHDIKVADIAELLGISRNATSGKINGFFDFKVGEVRELEKLGIPHELFF